ncbi:ribulose-phosphate 3-epimerase [Pectinatus cerevisiiphilus]|uniref:Ribulose-phosphate 3-epimerase n=1 Tax=Pectinatus cerevisiiphilus TaxID=86956 RepID=A0A4R3KDZ7_9FIRM|nr:ribulose-phosphate 3-epimerase [Pectinatus cerevisiiphilus]TCS81310.1 ribulose-5-phosphate 3-epimerase [Pectinatus cerevisiiphilus]
MKIVLSPSILSADFSCLADDVQRLEKSGIEDIHLDIMDGHFVDNITFGTGTIKSLRPHTKTNFDAHLMVTKPDALLAGLADAGVNSVTVHKEACVHLYHTLETIKKLGMDGGVVLNPATDYESLKYVARDGLLKKVLVMSVEPGFGGQAYLPMSTKKIADLAEWRDKNKFEFVIQVDGGINIHNIKTVIEAGATDIVIGSAMFKERQIEDNVATFRKAIEIF